MSKLNAYVRFWDRREGAESLALVRIGVGLVVLYDLLQVPRFDLVRAFWAPVEEGGLGPSSYAAPSVAFYAWFGASASGAWTLFALSVVSACTLCIGLYTRTSALCLLLCSVQLSALAPSTDRGVDALVRNVLCLLALSGAGAAWSIDARLRRRSQLQPARAIPAWPRYLLIAQLVLMYFSAGLLKQGPEWSSLGHYSALSRLLSHPHLSRYAWAPDQLAWLYPVLQLSTIATLAFERSAIALPALLWLHSHPDRGGRLGNFLRRFHVLGLWVATAAVFHLALAALVKLGIFPWACLALYPALAKPALWQSLSAQARRVVLSQAAR